MEKVVNLRGDEIFRHAQEYRDSHDYEKEAAISFKHPIITHIMPEIAYEVREALCDLVIRRQICPIDLKIIEARDCSPMPSNHEVARQLHMPVRTVSSRLARLKRLIPRDLHLILVK